MAAKAASARANEDSAATEIKYVNDARGRHIGVIKPNALLRFRLLKMLGPEGSKNESLLSQAVIASVVREIDGEKFQMPNFERELETRIGLLDDDGLSAAGQCLIEQFGFGASEADDHA